MLNHSRGRKALAWWAAALFLVAPLRLTGAADAQSNFLVLCYHDIPLHVSNDVYAVDLQSLVGQIQYLKAHDYTFLSPADILDSSRGTTPLPEKGVMLSFDDGYTSFHSNVIPVLELFDCPALLSPCPALVSDGTGGEIPAPVMGWDELREVARHPLVTIGSHSYDLHKALPYNPQGNKGNAATSRMYVQAEKRYETEAEYRARIEWDMVEARRIFAVELGYAPIVMTWPYGEASRLTAEIAKRHGFQIGFALTSGRANFDDMMRIDRWMILENPSIEDFAENLRHYTHPDGHPAAPRRGIQVDLDLIYDSSPEQFEANLGRLLERLVRIKPTSVYLQGFADPDGDGNVDAVYFPNRVLPVRGDILNRVANQLFIRGFEVYVWMPVLSIQPREVPDDGWVMERRDGQTGPALAGYRRLSPFAPETGHLINSLYEDLAIHVRFHGILFQDDAYLTDSEDFHPEALAAFHRATGMDLADGGPLDARTAARWTAFKTASMNDFVHSLMESVRQYRPNTRFARNFYAPILEVPESETRFAQNYTQALADYDQVVIMAYPRMEGVRLALPWLESLVERAARQPGGLERTMFKLQSYDWNRREWLAGVELNGMARRLVAAGARHIMYYPDDYTIDRPEQDVIRDDFSSEWQLYPKPLRIKPRP